MQWLGCAATSQGAGETWGEPALGLVEELMGTGTKLLPTPSAFPSRSCLPLPSCFIPAFNARQ